MMSTETDHLECTIKDLKVQDIRFPTSLELHGSDAVHKDPDYSAAYVTLTTDDVINDVKGHGIAFSLGRGNELIVMAIEILRPYVVGKRLVDIYNNFGSYWHDITQDGQLRWLGPEKGVIHMAAAGLLNALWDLLGKRLKKPVWRLLSDMTPEQIVSLLDLTYLSDVMTKQDAIDILREAKITQPERLQHLEENGYPAYTTSTAWLGYTDEVLSEKCRHALSEGWTSFKMKVGADVEDDKRRAGVIRSHIGYDNILMMDANERWDVGTAIDWMKQLAPYKPLWIEEPTSPDDVLGHATIAAALKPYGIGVATGEQCQNRVMFKQLLQAKAVDFVQIDSCRVGSVNENIAILLLAKHFGIPVCPHAGGVGLCEMVQHLIMFDYLCVSGSTKGRVCEYVDHLHEHFKYPVVIQNARYQVPTQPGYSTEMVTSTVEGYKYPDGDVWMKLAKDGKVVLSMS